MQAMTNQPITLPTQRVNRIWRWLRRIAIAAILLPSLYAGYVYMVTTWQWRQAVAQLDASDPDWRLENILAALPAADNNDTPQKILTFADTVKDHPCNTELGDLAIFRTT